MEVHYLGKEPLEDLGVPTMTGRMLLSNKPITLTTHQTTVNFVRPVFFLKGTNDEPTMSHETELCHVSKSDCN